MKTLYEFATEKMQESIQHYFEIVEKTNNFLDFDIELFEDPHARQMVLAGKSLEYKDLTPEQMSSEAVTLMSSGSPGMQA